MSAHPQPAPATRGKSRLFAGFLWVYALALLVLASTWYEHTAPFHFFNDVLEWAYLDKLGHFFTSFQLGRWIFTNFGAADQPGISKKWYCFAGFILLLPVEVLDGFAANYGASPADLLANGLGSIFCYAYCSYRVPGAFHINFSFHTTAFSALRPDLLGANPFQQGLKDYNGQTYWLSVDPNKLFNTSVFPRWLLLSVGYGAEGLLGGHDNVWTTATGQVADYSAIARTHRILLSIDIHFGAMAIKNKTMRYLLAPFDWFKFPAPAIEFNAVRGMVFHLVYF